MNGRVYDPKLGRFLQADPFIQAPDNTQSYNRYSYVINNPLNATDPSGFFFDGIGDFFKKFAGAIVTAVVTIYCQVCGPIVAGMLGGAVDAAVNGGNIFAGAAIGALSATSFGQTPLGQGALRGARNRNNGGNFLSGFLGAGQLPGDGFSDSGQGGIDGAGLSGQLARFVSDAAKGGTDTDETGGKFTNGADGSALAQAVNGKSSQARGSDNFKKKVFLSPAQCEDPDDCVRSSVVRIEEERRFEPLTFNLGPKVLGPKVGPLDIFMGAVELTLDMEFRVEFIDTVELSTTERLFIEQTVWVDGDRFIGPKTRKIWIPDPSFQDRPLTRRVINTERVGIVRRTRVPLDRQ